ncbi:MAG TPA: arsenic resistance N-acetyltransferase ArsN2 [Nevskiaceae bacterium]|nr:arsenic resistance N-acetyltransferase ArsN2 [Nevskiaceae bacterium]
MAIRPMRAAERPWLHTLLEAAGLPTGDLSTVSPEAFSVLEAADQLVGAVGLERFAEVALLRSLVVSPAHRQQGAGAALVAAAEQQARAQGIRALYLLTTDAEGFFSRLGYARRERETAPAAIRRHPQFAGLCPASSTFMSKAL